MMLYGSNQSIELSVVVMEAHLLILLKLFGDIDCTIRQLQYFDHLVWVMQHMPHKWL